MRRKTEKTLARHAKKTKVATQDASAKIVAAKIKADALKVLTKLAGPRADIETIMECGEWEDAHPITKRKLRTILKEVLAMCDEAEGKFGDKVPIQFSFDMSKLSRMSKEITQIKQRTKVKGVSLKVRATNFV